MKLSSFRLLAIVLAGFSLNLVAAQAQAAPVEIEVYSADGYRFPSILDGWAVTDIHPITLQVLSQQSGYITVIRRNDNKPRSLGIGATAIRVEAGKAKQLIINPQQLAYLDNQIEVYFSNKPMAFYQLLKRPYDKAFNLYKDKMPLPISGWK